MKIFRECSSSCPPAALLYIDSRANFSFCKHSEDARASFLIGTNLLKHTHFSSWDCMPDIISYVNFCLRSCKGKVSSLPTSVNGKSLLAFVPKSPRSRSDNGWFRDLGVQLGLSLKPWLLKQVTISFKCTCMQVHVGRLTSRQRDECINQFTRRGFYVINCVSITGICICRTDTSGCSSNSHKGLQSNHWRELTLVRTKGTLRMCRCLCCWECSQLKGILALRISRWYCRWRLKISATVK